MENIKKKHNLRIGFAASLAVFLVLLCAFFAIKAVVPAKAYEDATFNYLAYENGRMTEKTQVINLGNAISGGTTRLPTGWYFVSGDVSCGRLLIEGDVKILLLDGCHFQPSGGLSVPRNASLTIYAQSELTSTMGKLTASKTTQSWATIGGGANEQDGNQDYLSSGSITIHGGNLNIESPNFGGAAIGSAQNGTAGAITIHGGRVNTSNNSNHAAAIGAGYLGKATSITITGGVVYAKNGTSNFAGIGRYEQDASKTGDASDPEPTCTISGGVVIASRLPISTTFANCVVNEWTNSGTGAVSSTRIQSYGSPVITTDFTMPAGPWSHGGIATINPGVTVTVPSGGSFWINGNILNYGTIVATSADGLVKSKQNLICKDAGYIKTGSDIYVEDEATSVPTNLGGTYWYEVRNTSAGTMAVDALARFPDVETSLEPSYSDYAPQYFAKAGTTVDLTSTEYIKYSGENATFTAMPMTNRTIVRRFTMPANPVTVTGSAVAFSGITTMGAEGAVYDRLTSGSLNVAIDSNGAMTALFKLPYLHSGICFVFGGTTLPAGSKLLLMDLSPGGNVYYAEISTATTYAVISENGFKYIGTNTPANDLDNYAVDGVYCQLIVIMPSNHTETSTNRTLKVHDAITAGVGEEIKITLTAPAAKSATSTASTSAPETLTASTTVSGLKSGGTNVLVAQLLDGSGNEIPFPAGAEAKLGTFSPSVKQGSTLFFSGISNGSYTLTLNGMKAGTYKVRFILCENVTSVEYPMNCEVARSDSAAVSVAAYIPHAIKVATSGADRVVGNSSASTLTLTATAQGTGVTGDISAVLENTAGGATTGLTLTKSSGSGASVTYTLTVAAGTPEGNYRVVFTYGDATYPVYISVYGG